MQCPECGSKAKVIATHEVGVASLAALFCENGHINTTASLQPNATYAELSETLVAVAGLPGPERRLVRLYAIPTIEAAIREVAPQQPSKPSLARRRNDRWELQFLKERLDDPY